MAIVYLVKTGAVLHANGEALLKIEKIHRKCVTVSRLNTSPKTLAVIELNKVFLDSETGADVMLTQVYSSGPKGSLKLACKTQRNKPEITYSVDENNYQPT